MQFSITIVSNRMDYYLLTLYNTTSEMVIVPHGVSFSPMQDLSDIP